MKTLFFTKLINFLNEEKTTNIKLIKCIII